MTYINHDSIEHAPVHEGTPNQFLQATENVIFVHDELVKNETGIRILCFQKDNISRFITESEDHVCGCACFFTIYSIPWDDFK